nr:MAG TPA: hypothetical protein [Caudoviricetes sp.]
MKNREKYAKKILDIVCTGHIVAVKNGVPCMCKAISCRECYLNTTAGCVNNFIKWCNAEYIGTPIDWSKVPVDTPILVRDSENDMWDRRHFAKYENGKVYAFRIGGTSWSNDCYTCWKHAKLAADDEMDANSILRADGREEK